MTPLALAVIPARISSSRLPRKPLYPLAGRPLIEWVWRRVVAADVFARVVVATDSEEVEETARAFGAETVLTSPAHLSGTERVAEVSRRPEYAAFPLVVNVQGDEPFVRAEQLKSTLDLVRQGWPVGTVASRLCSVEEWENPAVVKVVRDESGRAMFFSRAPIPFRRDSLPTSADLAQGPFFRHLGMYAYQREALFRWVALPEGELERIERLEQLRPLAAGIALGVAVVASSPDDIGIDTPTDAAQADLRLRHELSPGATANV